MLEEICILFLIGSQLSYAMTSTSCSIVMNSIQQGFHRKLTTSVVLTFPPKSILKKSQCMVVLKEIFPGDIYIDPYQVHRLKGIQMDLVNWRKCLVLHQIAACVYGRNSIAKPRG